MSRYYRQAITKQKGDNNIARQQRKPRSTKEKAKKKGPGDMKNFFLSESLSSFSRDAAKSHVGNEIQGLTWEVTVHVFGPE
jgi:hypothetical protein